jgi:hypothetical protein
MCLRGRRIGSPLRILPEQKMKDLHATLPKVTGGNSGHHKNWILAVKGEEKTRSTFQVSGPLSQVFCLGVIAQRLGGELDFDPKTKQITKNKVANALLAGPPPRKGWEQYYKMV